MSKRKISFEDNGQDFLWWVIDEAGKVVDCGPFQAGVWCESVVELDSIEPGKLLKFTDRWGGYNQLIHKIESIELVA